MDCRILIEKKKVVCRSEKKAAESELIHELLKRPGSFAFVCEDDEKIVLAADSISSIPLFYSVTKDRIIVADNTEMIGRCIRLSINRDHADELESTAYAASDRTVFNEIKKVTAGGMTVIYKSDGAVKQNDYYEYKYCPDSGKTKNEWAEELDHVLQEVTEDLIRLLNGRTALLPLSGGWDSRTLAVYLKKAGYENVICFSYGRRDSFEVKISKQTADTLGYPWHFVPYSGEVFNKLFHSSLYINTLMKGGNGIYAAISQHLPALWILRKKGCIPKDAAAVPGHSLDFLCGSHFPYLEAGEIWTKQYFMEHMLKVHYSLNRGGVSKSFLRKIFDSVPEKLARDEIVQNISYWEWKSRQGVFISNDARVFEYFGYDFEFPFWDYRLVGLFLQMPYELLYHRALQRIHINRYVNLMAGMDQEPEIRNSVRQNHTLHTVFKTVRPVRKIYTQLRRYGELLYGWHHNCNAFYEGYTFGQYMALLMQYGSGFNTNSYTARDYMKMLEEKYHGF